MTEKENPAGFSRGVSDCSIGLRFAVAAENVDDFVSDDRTHRVPRRPEILTGVEVRGVECEVLSDGGGDCKTQVAVDIDFADCHTRRLAEHIFGHALCAGHIAAVLVDYLDVFLRNAGSAVEDDGETGETSADFFENVETESGLSLELECAVGGADGDCERIDAGLLDEFLNLVGVGVASVFGVNLDRVLNTREFAEFRFDDDTVIVCVLDDLLGNADVFGKGMGAGVYHNGSEAAVNAILAEFETVAVVEVQTDGETAGLDGRFDHFLEINGVGVLSGTRGNLQDKGGVFDGGRFDDTLNEFHIVDVESADCVAAVVCFLEHFGGCDQRHNKSSDVILFR